MNKIFTEDLSKTFITDGIKNSVLRDINFSISQGETCSIIGASGCGKSTFLHLLAKLDDYSSGRIFFNEINYSDLNSDSSASLRLDNFGFVYQFHHLLEDFNAFDNCKIVQDLNNHKNKLIKLRKYIEKNLGSRSSPKWNFYKYIIDKNGIPVNVFSSMTKPESSKFINALELELFG